MKFEEIFESSLLLKTCFRMRLLYQKIISEENLEFKLSLNELLTLIAIFLGPIVALGVQRLLDRSRAAGDARLKIFHSLMSTRATQLDSRHVEALNMINVAFYGRKKKYRAVVLKWKEYHAHLNELVSNDHPNFESLFTIWRQKMDDFLVELLQVMAKAVGYEFDSVEVRKGVYHPIGHDTRDRENALLRTNLLDLLSGSSSLNVKVTDDAKT
jgi:hypothetical protein